MQVYTHQCDTEGPVARSILSLQGVFPTERIQLKSLQNATEVYGRDISQVVIWPVFFLS